VKRLPSTGTELDRALALLAPRAETLIAILAITVRFDIAAKDLIVSFPKHITEISIFGVQMI
jgi:hypothetical protein